MTDNIKSLDLEKFKRVDDPAECSLISALEAAREWINEPETEAEHVIVFVGGKGQNVSRFFQAGSYGHHGQQGLCVEGALLMRESG